MRSTGTMPLSSSFGPTSGPVTTWRDDVSYGTGNLVRHEGVTYQALSPSNAEEPVSGSEFWEAMESAGSAFDPRLPDPGDGDPGQIVTVNEAGTGYVLDDAPEGGGVTVEDVDGMVTEALNEHLLMPDPHGSANWAAYRGNHTGTQPLSTISDAGTAAAADVGDFATAAQGTAADSAVQPGDLADVATSGDYNDLMNKPNLAVKADLVGGKVPTSQIPAAALVEFLGEAADETAMLALSGQPGDWCIRTDLSMNAVITGPNPADVDDWTLLAYPSAAVVSVNGQVGAVTLASADVGAVSDSDVRLSDQRVPTANSVDDTKVADGTLSQGKISGLVNALLGKLNLSLFTGKGTLAAGTGAGAAGTVAAGTNGYVLTADSAEATGMKWAASSLSNMADTRIKGRAVGAGTGTPQDLTPAQIRRISDADLIYAAANLAWGYNQASSALGITTSVSAVNAGTALSGATTVIAPNSSAIRWDGPPMENVGTISGFPNCYRQTAASQVSLGSAARGSSTGLIGNAALGVFCTDSPDFEIIYRVQEPTVAGDCVYVDGEYLSLHSTFGGATGNIRRRRVTSPSREPREITFEAQEITVLGIQVGALDSVWAPDNSMPRPLHIPVMDSYVVGDPADQWIWGAYPVRAGRRLGWNSVPNGVSGTGFIHTAHAATQNYVTRLPSDVIARNPDIVSIHPSVNDVTGAYGSTPMGTAIQSAESLIRTGLPGARVFVGGGLTPLDTHNALAAVNESLVSTTFVNANQRVIPQTTWINGTGRVGATTGVGNSDLYTSSDGIHLSAAGYTYCYHRWLDAVGAFLRRKKIPADAPASTGLLGVTRLMVTSETVLTAGAAYLPLNMTEDRDDLGIHTGSNPYCTIAVTGDYRITAHAGAVAAGMQNIAMQVQLNGSYIPGVVDAQNDSISAYGGWASTNVHTGALRIVAGSQVQVAVKVAGAPGVIYPGLASLTIERVA